MLFYCDLTDGGCSSTSLSVQKKKMFDLICFFPPIFFSAVVKTLFKTFAEILVVCSNNAQRGKMLQKYCNTYYHLWEGEVIRTEVTAETRHVALA